MLVGHPSGADSGLRARHPSCRRCPWEIRIPRRDVLQRACDQPASAAGVQRPSQLLPPRPRQGPSRPISIVARPRSPQSQPVGWVRHCAAKGTRPVCLGWEGGPGKESVFLLIVCVGDAPTPVEKRVVHSASPLASLAAALRQSGPSRCNPPISCGMDAVRHARTAGDCCLE